MKKLGVICLVLRVVLVMMRAVYAKWSRTLTDSGNANTGTFDEAFDSFRAPSGSHGATFSTTRADSHTYNIALRNLCPSWDAIFAFVLKDTGTIPAKILAVKINDTNYSSPVPLRLGSDTNYDITSLLPSCANQPAGPISLIPADGGKLTGGHLKVHT
jgi:hypothetical protein